MEHRSLNRGSILLPLLFGIPFSIVIFPALLFSLCGHLLHFLDGRMDGMSSAIRRKRGSLTTCSEFISFSSLVNSLSNVKLADTRDAEPLQKSVFESWITSLVEATKVQGARCTQRWWRYALTERSLVNMFSFVGNKMLLATPVQR